MRLLAQTASRPSEWGRVVLTLYFLENLTLDEIGGTLRVSESRVRRTRARVVLWLRLTMLMNGYPFMSESFG